jgi:hypothetical protein
MLVAEKRSSANDVTPSRTAILLRFSLYLASRRRIESVAIENLLRWHQHYAVVEIMARIALFGRVFCPLQPALVYFLIKPIDTSGLETFREHLYKENVNIVLTKTYIVAVLKVYLKNIIQKKNFMWVAKYLL